MIKFWSRLKEATKIIPILVLAFLLAGIDRSGKENKFDVGDLAIEYESSDVPVELWYAVGAGSFVIIVLIIILALIARSRRKKKIQELAQERAVMQLETELKNRGIGDSGRELLQRISHSSESGVIFPIIQDICKFEETVASAKSEETLSDMDMVNLHALRHQLGYTVENIEIPFVNTRMLQAGFKVQATLKKGQNTSNFKSVVISTNEKQLQIKPPTFKGKPANLSSFKFIICQVRREKDAIYEAMFRVKGQKKKEPFGVVLEQTDKIKKVKDLQVIEDEQMSEIDDWVDSLVQDNSDK